MGMVTKIADVTSAGECPITLVSIANVRKAVAIRKTHVLRVAVNSDFPNRANISAIGIPIPERIVPK